ncbi:MAG: peptidase domain-containing ABC transporter [Lentisphaerae bacterium]|nr:peptidase domain-containing ABC transporter [Lentisphaerota bacterium]
MSEIQLKNPSGIECLRRLFGQFRRNINFDALLTNELRERCGNDEQEVIIELANNHDLRPEKHSDIVEIAKTYNGPALLRLNNNSWILILRSQQIIRENAVAIFDPTTDKTLLVKKEQLLERAGDAVVIFRNLQEIDAQEQSALFCLCAIARHHNISMDLRRVMHDFAIDTEEPRLALLRSIADSYELKTRMVKMKFDKLISLGQAYPAMGKKQNGKYVVICGIRPNQDETTDLVVLDPEKTSAESRFTFMSKDDVEAELTNEVMLLKRRYKLSDEDRPFSLAWFLPEFFKLRGIFAQIALTVAMITVLSLIVPLFFQIVVDKVLINKSYNTLNVLGIGIIAAVIFNGFLDFLRSYFLLFATNKIDVATATKTFRHLMRLPVDFFERVPSGVLLKHMQQTEKIRGFLSGNLFFTILDLCSLCIFIPVLLLYTVELTLVVLGYSALMALVIACLIKPFQRRLNELYQAEGKRQSMLVEAIHGVRTVKSLALEPVQEKYWDDSTAYAVKSYFRVGKISMSAKSISQVLEMMMTISVIWLGALLVFEHHISVGALIAFQMLANRVTGPLVKLVGLIHEYQQIALSVKMLGVVMNTPVEPQGGGVRNPLRGAIDFENITFQYRQDLPAVIKGLSLSVQPGTTLGIVGRSGSGKTTITKLLQGLYPVVQGLIKIDGIDLREIDKSHLRSSIGVVLQENYFFSGTVRENISLTKRNASIEEIIYAAKLAGADEFIQKLPRGYDTMLEENASNLSGGQKQRLAIARALLNNPPVLIFDEATSALDPESELVIQNNLKSIARGRTVLIISHRLSIVSGADQIVVIDNGQISAKGTHQELLNQPGTYREFWHQQMRIEK